MANLDYKLKEKNRVSRENTCKIKPTLSDLSLFDVSKKSAKTIENINKLQFAQLQMKIFYHNIYR